MSAELSFAGVNDIATRKEDHLALCARGEVGFEKTSTLFEEIELVHTPLPELSLGDIDLKCTLLGKTLAAPLMISAMTGGTEQTGKINRELASVAENLGIGFGLGSQRPMLENPSLASTYTVRETAPSTLVIGNLGLWQVHQRSTEAIENLVRQINADAIAIHLNPAQELVQPEGDRDFRGGLDALKKLRESTEIPIIVKETGCGVSGRTASKLLRIGIDHIDVAGSGGTSWVAVEEQRASGRAQDLARVLRDWGIPTAVSVKQIADLDSFETILASGGIQTGLDVAKSIALGASAAGIARPVLAAYWKGGAQAAEEYLSTVIETLRAILLLTGCSTLDDLKSAPRVLGPKFRVWLDGETQSYSE